jgi:SulP family sulfate permease
MLSTLSISPTTPLTTGTPADEYFGPALPTHFEVSETSESPGSVRKGGKDKDKDAEDAINIERGSPSKSILKSSGPSTLTLQLKRNSNPSSTAGSRDVSPLRPEQSPSVVPMPEMNTITPPSQVQAMPSSAESFLSPARPAGRIKIPAIITPTEETRLISDAILPAYTISQPDSRPIHKPEPRRSKSLSKHFRVAVDQAKVATKPSFWVDVSLRSINALPAVFLGLLLNILDAVSYGMIIFPAGDMFQGLGPMGVSLFFVTYVEY